MAQHPSVDVPWRLIISQGMYEGLRAQLFPGDGDEHGAVLLAGIAESRGEVRLLVRELYLPKDGVDYVPGKRGYRMLRAEFIRDLITRCRDERLVYLAVHNHHGTNSVGFSQPDMQSHERGYPALLDIANGMPVGALVFADCAVAGDIWLPSGQRIVLAGASIVNTSLKHLTPHPVARVSQRQAVYDRQARLFGDVGQELLASAKVGIIGLGGIGSIVAEYLGRLGVGHIVLADPDRAELTNLPRLLGAKRSDVIGETLARYCPEWLAKYVRKLSKTKVNLARRNILRANPRAVVQAIFGNFADARVAAAFTDCDYLFLAADSMQARLVFNAIVHQYLIPGIQMGSKVSVEPKTGAILDVFSVVRPVNSDSGCLICNGLISAAKLQDESISESERRAQRYIDEPGVVAPSVVTLNAVSASHAVNTFLTYITALRSASTPNYFWRCHAVTERVMHDEPRKSHDCIECGRSTKSRLGRGSAVPLPVRM